MPFLKGETQAGPRHEFLYWTDDGDLAALRYNKWKVMFLEQRAQGFDTWQEPFVQLRLPKLFDLHADPYERAEYEAIDYAHWRVDRHSRRDQPQGPRTVAVLSKVRNRWPVRTPSSNIENSRFTLYSCYSHTNRQWLRSNLPSNGLRRQHKIATRQKRS